MKRMFFLAFLMAFVPLIAGAHCDTLDGPVIGDAKVALQKGDVTPVLKWVKKEHESEIREAFAKTMFVRDRGAEARELADMYFFETLVRIHRSGEGAGYTGLKSAGSAAPGIQAADDALASGSVDALVHSITANVSSEIRDRFERAQAAKKNADAGVEHGRAYVEAYVDFLHYVESLQENSGPPAPHEHQD